MTTTTPNPSGDPVGEAAALRERLSHLSAASLRINESLDLDKVLQDVLDSARSLAGARYGVLAIMDDSGQVEALPGHDAAWPRRGCAGTAARHPGNGVRIGGRNGPRLGPGGLRLLGQALLACSNKAALRESSDISGILGAMHPV